MSGEVQRPWTDEQLKSDDLGKREMVEFLQSHSNKEVRFFFANSNIAIDIMTYDHCHCSLYSTVGMKL